MTFTVMLILLVLLMVLLLLLGGWGRTYQMEQQTSQAVFRGGSVPAELPDGFYRGEVSADIPRKGWQGKIFDRRSGTGINQFTSDRRYVFKLYPVQGLRDRRVKVLRIDYRQPGNPWWLGFIVDEIVQTKPDHYLGKVHLRLMPGLLFTLAYFELRKAG